MGIHFNSNCICIARNYLQNLKNICFFDLKMELMNNQISLLMKLQMENIEKNKTLEEKYDNLEMKYNDLQTKYDFIYEQFKCMEVNLQTQDNVNLNEKTEEISVEENVI